MQQVDTLILRGQLLTMNEQDECFEDGGVAIVDGRILAVGSSAELEKTFQAKETIDATGQVVMPGLIDTYAHAGHGLIRGLFHPQHGWPAQLYWQATTENWWYAEALLSACERLRFGVTTGQSIIGATPARMDSPVFAEKNALAYQRVGSRLVLGVGPPDPIFSHLTEPWQGSFVEDGVWHQQRFSYQDTLRHSIQIIKDWHGAAKGRIRVALAPPYLLGRHVKHARQDQPLPGEQDVPAMLEHALEMRELANKHDVIIHTHMFKGSVDFARQHFGPEVVETLLGPDVVIAHANGLQQAEVELLGASHCNIATVAYTHENIWYGYAPMIDLLEAGANVTIATDGSAPYTSLDLWRELARATWNQWQHYHDQMVLPAGKVLRMVTIDAARALGVADELGSLEVGKKADLILVTLNKAHLTPSTSLPRLLVHYAQAQDVDTVFVEGKMLMREGEILTVDLDEVMAGAQEEAEALFSRTDLALYKQEDRAFWRAARVVDAKKP